VAARSSTDGYAQWAPRMLAARLPFEAAHAPILHLIPQRPSRVLDVGSGPGHDAATLAAMGHAVTAAEPVPELLAGAMALHGADTVQWIDDGLPALAKVRALGTRFDFVLMSGVWMHLDAAERRAAMPTVAALMAPDAVLALSLRHGWVPPGRRMFEVGAQETIALAAESGLTNLLRAERGSVHAVNRAAGVTWTFLAFRRPA
jgi:SAM-dependent methyltransferase